METVTRRDDNSKVKQTKELLYFLKISDVKGNKRRNIKFHANMNLSRNYFEEFKNLETFLN